MPACEQAPNKESQEKESQEDVGHQPGVGRELNSQSPASRNRFQIDRYRIPGCFTSIPLSCIFSCSTLGLTSKAVARLMYSFVTK